MIDPKEHPMLLAEPPLNTQQQREKYDLSALKYPFYLYCFILECVTDFLISYAWQGSGTNVWKIQSSCIVYG